jgi:DNA-directed RNA polymerase subunit beta
VTGLSAAASPFPPGTRDPTDFASTRKAVYDSVLAGVQQRYPLENDTHRLEISDLAYEGDELPSRADQKRAILSRGSVVRPLRGTWKLTRKDTGEVLDSRRSIVANVPVFTERGTYILNGSENAIAHQMRLRSGVYTRRKDNGEYEAHVNVLRGGPSFRIGLDPKTGIFHLAVGQGTVPLYPVLKEAGISDEAMTAAFGAPLLQTNAGTRASDTHLNRFWARLAGVRAAKEVGGKPATRNLRALFEQMELDPEVTGFTLGAPYSKATPEVILAAAAKVLKASRGDVETDDRDSLAYQETMGPDDLFRERIVKDSGRLASRLLWRATLRNNLKGVPAAALDPQLKAVFYGSGLGGSLEEVNPLDAIDQSLRVTRMGEGGLPDSSSIPDDARMVNPSQFTYIDPVRSVESTAIGVDLRLARNTRKGVDRALYSRVKDAKTGEDVWVPPQVMARATVIFPGERERAAAEGRTRLAAIRGGRLVYVKPEEAQFEGGQQSDAFNVLSNLSPALSAAKGGRLLMGSKFFLQALPMKEREAPLVLVEDADQPGHSAEAAMGRRVGAVFASVGGKVAGVSPAGIEVIGPDGKTVTHELYDSFPFNRKSFLHNEAAVAVGDVVQPGQLIATSNYTDKNGALAMGRNLRVGYMAHKDSVYEDAILISEDAAKRLSTERMYTEKLDQDKFTEPGLARFLALYPSAFSRSQLDKLDPTGVVRVGAVVTRDDPVVVAVRQQVAKGSGMLYRGKNQRVVDASRVWEHDYPGVVTDTWTDSDGVKVAIKAYAPVSPGDKLVLRQGSKGVVSRVLPDDQMPVGEDGRPLQVLFNPHGLITRSNPSQVLEALLGKVAERRGSPYVLPQQYGGDWLEYVKKELADNGVTPEEDLMDPVMRRKIPKVVTGNMYVMALHHVADAKESGRGLGAYSSDGAPVADQDEENPKRIGTGEMAALIAHGAPAVVREVKLIRGQKNDDYWKAMTMGYPPPSPGVPATYRRLIASMRAAGINVKEDGRGRNHLMAMTDAEVVKLSAGEITEPATLQWFSSFERGAHGEASQEPVAGGLFDRGITGGHGGDRWGHITLQEPMPNPAFEDPVRYLLGMTRAKFEAVLSGTEEIEGLGTGPKAMQEALRRMDTAKDMERLRGEYRATASITKRDALLKRMKYLDGLRAQGLEPRDLMLTKVPVLPPVFRPISVNQKFSAVASPNVLYMDLMNANKNLKDLAAEVDGAPVSDARLAVYNAMRAVVGTGDPIKPSRIKQNVRGILDEVFGSTGPKSSLIQRRLIGGTVDLSGRAVITPDPNLNMDEIGVPENLAWSLFGRFAVQKLTRQMGDNPDSRLQAVRLVATRDKRAKAALLEAMKERPVLSSRAPALHKFSIMGFEPRLVPGNTIRYNSFITSGMGADYDGDTVNLHAVVTPDAVREVREKMMASSYMRSPADFAPLHTPRQEYLMGLYTASTARTKKPMTTFKTRAAALAAFRRGELEVGDPVEVLSDE